jgi:hypothetical protein
MDAQSQPLRPTWSFWAKFLTLAWTCLAQVIRASTGRMHFRARQLLSRHAWQEPCTRESETPRKTSLENPVKHPSSSSHQSQTSLCIRFLPEPKQGAPWCTPSLFTPFCNLPSTVVTLDDSEVRTPESGKTHTLNICNLSRYSFANCIKSDQHSICTKQNAALHLPASPICQCRRARWHALRAHWPQLPCGLLFPLLFSFVQCLDSCHVPVHGADYPLLSPSKL